MRTCRSFHKYLVYYELNFIIHVLNDLDLFNKLQTLLNFIYTVFGDLDKYFIKLPQIDLL